MVIRPENAVHGKELDQLLVRSKLVLAIYYSEEVPTQVPDLARIDHLLSNRIFVLHEKSPWADLFPGFEQHVANCTYEEIPDCCDFYLKNTQERQRISESAYEWFKTTYSLDQHIPYQDLSALLDSLKAGRR
ncbi:MAG: hypothetical protein HC904_16785 [Blastochloris sp.]|nr:hypothetical protein [Blastochloris sp.]